MKKNFPVTGKEFVYNDNQRIISVTDAKGIITQVNEDFCQIAGFSEDELSELLPKIERISFI